ncbi:hypothetical protein GCM10028818_22420 [Spirosoma horti]
MNWVIIALLVLLVGCQKATDPLVTAANPDCQLQSESTTSNGSLQQATTYAYNNQGQLIKSVQTSARGIPITYTYAYDAAGNLVSSLTQGTLANIDFTSTSAYEYTDGRLTKLTGQSSSTVLTTDNSSYSYDGSGRLATYYTNSSDPSSTVQSYTFTNGILTSGIISQSGQVASLTITNGRIASVDYPTGGQNRFSYDATGYNVRQDSFDKAGVLQLYIVSEYSPTPYKQASTPYQVVPKPALYGKTDLPLSRQAIYNADGSLRAETRYTYQVNSQGYLISSNYVKTQTGVSGQGTSITTYIYTNCQ